MAPTKVPECMRTGAIAGLGPLNTDVVRLTEKRLVVVEVDLGSLMSAFKAEHRVGSDAGRTLEHGEKATPIAAFLASTILPIQLRLTSRENLPYRPEFCGSLLAF